MTREGLKKEDLKVSKSTRVIVSNKAFKAYLRNFQRNGLASHRSNKRKTGSVFRTTRL